ncbi:unnamed protein product [Symbiodinium sp. CCMP2592]|nr:unnamed protein product [Symbiodinium sp. CCMP2592]
MTQTPVQLLSFMNQMAPRVTVSKEEVVFRVTLRKEKEFPAKVMVKEVAAKVPKEVAAKVTVLKELAAKVTVKEVAAKVMVPKEVAAKVTVKEVAAKVTVPKEVAAKVTVAQVAPESRAVAATKVMVAQAARVRGAKEEVAAPKVMVVKGAARKATMILMIEILQDVNAAPVTQTSVLHLMNFGEPGRVRLAMQVIRAAYNRPGQSLDGWLLSRSMEECHTLHRQEEGRNPWFLSGWRTYP